MDSNKTPDITRALNRFRGIELPDFQKLSGISSELVKRFQDSIQFHISPELTARIEEIGKRLRESIERDEVELPILFDYLAGRSWYQDFSCPIQLSNTLKIHAERNESAEVDRLLTEYYRSQAGQIEQSLGRNFPNRTKVLGSAFAAYKSGAYDVAIPTFLAQADGISYDVINAHFFIFKKSGPAAKEEIKKQSHNSYAEVLLGPLATQGIIRTHTDKLPSGEAHLNRHAVMHGLDLNYGTEINALKSISLLSYLDMAGCIIRNQL